MKRPRLARGAIACLMSAAAWGCADRAEEPDSPPAVLTRAAAFESPALSVEAFRAHASALAHDSMTGRAPGTPGGEMAASYLDGAFRQAGLEVVAGADGYRQEVPLLLVSVRAESVTGQFVTETNTFPLDGLDILVSSHVRGRRIELDVPIEFVGHGISLPGTDWNDYQRRDLDGAFVVTLPGVPEGFASRFPESATAFAVTGAGKAAAARQAGARGLIELMPPGTEERFASRRRSAEIVFPTPAWTQPYGPDFQLLLGPGASAELLAAARTGWDEASAAGATGNAAFDRTIGLALAFDQVATELTAPNIVGVVEGGTDETVVVTAHYDAYGIGPAAEGDSIYNGSTDNAAGTAGLVEVARSFAGRAEPPARTIVFVATTAEEGGMLGARYYLDNPVGTRESIMVNVNIDGLGFSPPTEDFTVFPVVGTDVVPTLEQLAAPLDLSFQARPGDEGMHYAFDTIEFLTRGVVGITVWQGSNVREEFRDLPRVGGPIHSPADEYSPDSNDAAIEQHLALYRAIIDYYAEGGEPPRLTEGNPFGDITRATEVGR